MPVAGSSNCGGWIRTVAGGGVAGFGVTLGRLAVSDNEADERPDRGVSAAFRELGSSGSSESFKLAVEGGMDLADPDIDGKL